VSWALVLVLALGAYVCKVLGLVVIGGRTLPPVARRCLELIPAALVSALIVVNTFSSGRQLVLDERALGVAAAGLATRRRAPIVVVIGLGALVTALARQL
jgi:branched-subunit amino acid transport protein